MCGVAFFFQHKDVSSRLSTHDAFHALQAIEHRGPDGYGMAFGSSRESKRLIHNEKPRKNASWTYLLGHRRLAILDTSDAGLQPMSHQDIWMTFNGEVYNFVELRAELEKLDYRFETGTDSEVILKAYAAWGMGAFERFNGMFSIILVDQRQKRIVYARDRLGIKPLYHAEIGEGQWALVSEPKQLFVLPKMKARVNEAVLERYMTSGYGGSGDSFFAGIKNVEPGVVFACDLNTGCQIDAHAFWSPEKIEANPDMSEAEAASLVWSHLNRATNLRLRSDVPVAAALSGGLDSSSIVMLMKEKLQASDAAEQLKTFSVLFSGTNVDETPFVKAVLQKSGVQNIAVQPAFDDWWAEKSDWAYHHDEPVGSTAQYAAYQLARSTREAGCPVSLNGQGGDEVFAGYWQSCFANLFSMARKRRFVDVAETTLGSLIPGGNPDILMQVPFILSRYLERRRAKSSGVDNVIGMSVAARRVEEIRTIHLPRLLKWDDRNLMAFSVEGRYPFLDHELIEAMLTIPVHLLYKRGWVKAPLRHAMKGTLPDEITWRRSKWGFETPQETWWRENQHILRDHLSGSLLNDTKWLSSARVDELFQMLRGGTDASRKAGHDIFRLIMLDVWAERFNVEL